MRTTLALLFIVLAGLFTPAEANGNASLRVIPYVVPSGCPFPVDNGCAGSVAGQAGSGAVLFTSARTPNGILNQLTGLPTDYSVAAPAVNFPAVDYWVGEPLPLASLKDPTNPANLPSGCTLAPTAGPGANPTITCNVTGTNNLTFDSFDMTAGGTTCIALGITGTSTGTATVTNNYWKNNGNCSAGTFAQEMFVAVGMTGGNLIFEYNTLDGNGVNFPYDYGSCAPPTGTALPNCNPGNAYLIAGGATVEYNAIIGFTSRTLQYQSLNITKGLLFQYNLLQGCCSANPAAHGEFEEYIGNPGAAGQTYDSNTIIDTTAHHTSGEAAIPIQLNNLNAVPILDVSNNLYLPGVAGGGDVSSTVAGTMSGNNFTSTSVSGGRIFSGSLITCGTAPNQVTGMLQYQGSTGTTPAGPGGGGNSGYFPTAPTLNQNSTWPMTWGASSISAGLDDGAGNAGNILTVTADPTITLQVGSGVNISGARFITGFLTGTGTTGTYTVGGTAALAYPSFTGSLSGNTLTITGSITGTVATGQIITGAGISGQPVITAGSGLSWTFNGAAQTVGSEAMRTVFAISASPDNIFPGGWGVPGTLACASATHNAAPFTRAITDETNAEPLGQATHQGNYADLWAYGPTSGGHIWSQRTAPIVFNGEISGSTLTNVGTVNSTTVTAVGSGYTTATIAYGSGCTTTPVGTVNLGSGGTAGEVISITQTVNGSGCTSIPSATISGSGSGATATANETFLATPAVGELITTTSGVAPQTIITAGTNPTFTVSGSQTIGPVSMTATQTYCTNVTIWGGNVDMAGIYNSTQMNSYGTGESVPGNGCQ